MTPFEFTPYLTAGIWLYIIILFLFSFIYIPVFFKLSFSVFDPFFLILIGSYFSSVLVVYLYLIDLIDYKYFIYYVFSEILFFLGMLLFSHRKSTVFYNRGILNKDKLDNLSIVKSMILVSSFLYFLSTSLDYYINGIPVFRITYIGAFVGSGGLGIIERFNDVSLNVLTLSLFTILLSKRNFINKKFWVNISIVILLFIILTFFLSGSKSKILILGAAWVYVVVFLVFGRYYNKLPRFFLGFKGISLICCSLIIAVFVIYLQDSRGGILLKFSSLAYRFVNYGDVFLYAFIDDNIRELVGDNPFLGLFGGFLSVFRIISPDNIYTPIGIQLPLIVQPGLDYLSGPNARHNIVGLHYFGFYGGVFYSLIIGCFISVLRFRFFKYIVGNFSGFVFYFLISKSLITLHVDFEYSMSKLASVIIVYPIILLIAYCLCGKKYNEKHTNIASNL